MKELKEVRGERFYSSLKMILLCAFFSSSLLFSGNLKANANYPDGTADLQQLTVTGIVSDENGSPMPGVNIQLQGTTVGVITDISGRYSITVGNPNEGVLLFSFIGYNSQSLPVSGRSSINVSMEPSFSTLDEVIVIGYGVTRKADLTGSISAVGDEQYVSQPVTRVDDILQGRSAGVNVTSVSGAPGGATSIRIRGSNSITGSNEPLYVIDGFVGGDIRNVNPTDIESIQVLKDASSTSIYGSRGANGVVLLTTKSGSAGDPKLTLSTRFYLSNPIAKWPLLNAYEFAMIANERAAALGYDPRYTDAEVAFWASNKGTDWQDEIFRTAGGEEFQLDYSGGTDRYTFFVSGNYLNQDGILLNSVYKRYSLRTNVSAKLSDRLNASLKVNFARRETNNVAGNYNTNSGIATAAAWAPTTPVYDANGKYTAFDPISSIKANPVEQVMNDRIQEINNFSTNGNFNYELLDGLTLDLGFGVNYSNLQGKDFTLNLQSNDPSAARNSTENLFLQNTNNLTYTRIFNGIHNLTVTAVAEYQLQQQDQFNANANKLLFPSLRYDNISLAGMYVLSNNIQKSTIGSYIGRINYNLLNKYLVTASMRSDRSSKFRGSNQTSFFPSIGLGWRVSGESFMQNLDFISNLKLRASWGETGSQAINVFGTVTSFITTAGGAGMAFDPGILTSGVKIGSPGNEDLRWETTRQTNVGFDLGILKDRLTVEADYYYKYTFDLLISEAVPGYVGGGSIYKNIGAVSNRGFEFNFNGAIVDKKDFSWNANFNISFINNQVEDLGAREYITLNGGAGAGQLQSNEMILQPGYSISTYYGLKSLGIWQENEIEQAALYNRSPGDYKYEDINGDFTLDGKDFQIIGSGLPKKMIGFNNTLTYKGLTLNAFFQSMLDYDKWNFAYAQIMIAAADAREFMHRDILERWSPENPTSQVAAFNKTTVPQIQSSHYIENGNYLRLKNLSLTYVLPKNLIRWGDISATISAQNIWTLTKYKGLDPETYSNLGSGDSRGGDGGAYPNAKTWTFGLSLNL